MGEAIRVLLVDDHELAREGLQRVLDMEPDIQVVGHASDGEEAVAKAQALSPDVILMDIKMPTINGLEATRRLNVLGMGGKVIVLSVVDEYLAQAIEAGAAGYLTKDVKRDELVNAIRRVHQGELVLGTSLMSNPKVGERLVNRLQDIAGAHSKGGIAQVRGEDEAGSSEASQKVAGHAAGAEERKGSTGGFRRDSRAPDGTITIMFSDIQGLTAMAERLGDRQAQQLLLGHHLTVRHQVASYGGFEVKSMGDGFMLAFSSARRALQCAIAIQRAFAAYNLEHADEPMRVRMGLHTGEAIRQADDFYGKHVILASRITGQARGGQILVSALLKELTESSGDIRFGEGRDVQLKGLAELSRVYLVKWQEGQ